MLFNEPKLLKFYLALQVIALIACFSALQRAEIAEIRLALRDRESRAVGFSALQRAEIAEIDKHIGVSALLVEFQCSSTSRNC